MPWRGGLLSAAWNVPSPPRRSPRAAVAAELLLLGFGYPVVAVGTLQWYARRKVNEAGAGRLGDPESPGPVP